MVAEFVREQILLRTREEVPHGIAVTIDTFDEDEKKGHKVALTVHVVKESHKKIQMDRPQYIAHPLADLCNFRN